MRKYLFSPLFVSAILFCCFSGLLAQNSTQKDSDEKDKQEKVEIERFFSEFVKDFEIHKDLNKVSPEFFAPEFKRILAQNNNWIKLLSSEEVYDQLSESERYQDNISFSNFVILMMMTTIHKVEGLDNSNLKNEEFRKLLLPSTVELIEKSKWFRSILADTDERKKPETKEEWCSYINEANNICDAWRKELERTTEKEKINYKRNYTELHNQTESFNALSCKDDNCFGLPENTQIYEAALFMTAVIIAKINGQFKVVNIYPITFN